MTPLEKFTPGPWTRDEDSVFIFGLEMEMIAEMRGEGANLPIEANADLIAAATEMYRVLDSIFAWFEKHGYNHSGPAGCSILPNGETLGSNIRSALRAARGEK